MTNKTYRFAAVAAVLLALCLVFIAPVSAEEASNNLFGGGTGTFDDPFLIGTPDQFANITMLSVSDQTACSTQSPIYLKLSNDIIISDFGKGPYVELELGGAITLDLNGHNVSATTSYDDAVVFIKIKDRFITRGSFTITDNSQNKNGLLELTHSQDAGSNKYSYVIHTWQTNLTLSGGSIKDNSQSEKAYALYFMTQPSWHEEGAVFTMTGGEVISTYGSAIRLYSHVITPVSAIISGGKIQGGIDGIRITQANAIYQNQPSGRYSLIISDNAEIIGGKHALNYELTNNADDVTIETTISGGSLSSTSGETISYIDDGASSALTSIENHKLTISGNVNLENDGNYGIIGVSSGIQKGPTVTFNSKPTITGASNILSKDGLKGTFIASQMGSSYEWYIDGVKVDGKTGNNAELTFTATSEISSKKVIVKAILSDVYNVTSDEFTVTIPAKYTVSFNANGGSGTISEGYAYSDATSFTLPTNEFTAPSGKVFKAWNISNTEYNECASVTINADTVVYAVWKDEVITPDSTPEQPSKKPSPTSKPKPVEPETPAAPEAGEATVETEVSNGGEVKLETPVAGNAPAGKDDAKITGVVLPEGTKGKVTFIPVSEKPAPVGKETQTKKVFEINVPTYEKGKAAVVKFTMTVAELTADGKTAADVALWHFDEETGEWTKLVTSFTIVDGIVYFEAITYDFSPFAIIYEDAPAEEPTEEPTEEPSTPAPLFAVLAGLGAAVILRRK